MATFVLVHGGGHGGWCYQLVARRLQARGADGGAEGSCCFHHMRMESTIRECQATSADHGSYMRLPRFLRNADRNEEPAP